jgi:hypothetical protein
MCRVFWWNAVKKLKVLKIIIKERRKEVRKATKLLSFSVRLAHT